MRMRTIVVDDEVSSLLLLQKMTESMKDIQLVRQFQTAQETVEYVKENVVDLVFLDIQLADLDGIALGKKLKALQKDIMLIFVTGYDQYAMEAIRLHAAAYLLKPYSEEDLCYAIETAQLLSKRFMKKIYAKTFGHFDLFVDGKPVMFKSAKAKELLALLIDREGGTVTTDQIIGTLWENRPNDEATQNLCSKAARRLRIELKSYGADGILNFSRGVRSVDTEKFHCDLFELLKGNHDATEQYFGEYLSEYSWAEEKKAFIEQYIKNNKKM